MLNASQISCQFLQVLLLSPHFTDEEAKRSLQLAGN